jgi:hypothetical protein
MNRHAQVHSAFQPLLNALCPAPAPMPASMVCPTCKGDGYTEDHEDGNSSPRCTSCEGVGHVDPALFDA